MLYSVIQTHNANFEKPNYKTTYSLPGATFSPVNLCEAMRSAETILAVVKVFAQRILIPRACTPETLGCTWGHAWQFPTKFKHQFREAHSGIIELLFTVNFLHFCLVLSFHITIAYSHPRYPPSPSSSFHPPAPPTPSPPFYSSFTKRISYTCLKSFISFEHFPETRIPFPRNPLPSTPYPKISHSLTMPKFVWCVKSTAIDWNQ